MIRKLWDATKKGVKRAADLIRSVAKRLVKATSGIVKYTQNGLEKLDKGIDTTADKTGQLAHIRGLNPKAMSPFWRGFLTPILELFTIRFYVKVLVKAHLLLFSIWLGFTLIGLAADTPALITPGMNELFSNLKQAIRSIPSSTSLGMITQGGTVYAAALVDSPCDSRGLPTHGTFVRGFFPGHSGVDIDGYIGELVPTTIGGTVAYAGWNNDGYGNLVIVQTPDAQTQTYYAHLSEIYTEVGKTVELGEIIGEIGSTGNSSAPHLHYEVRVGWNNAINPQGLDAQSRTCQ